MAAFTLIYSFLRTPHMLMIY